MPHGQLAGDRYRAAVAEANLTADERVPERVAGERIEEDIVEDRRRIRGHGYARRDRRSLVDVEVERVGILGAAGDPDAIRLAGNRGENGARVSRTGYFGQLGQGAAAVRGDHERV